MASALKLGFGFMSGMVGHARWLFQLLPVIGARRAIPRRIHGVRLAISATARSDGRIALRGPGVGVDGTGATGS